MQLNLSIVLALSSVVLAQGPGHLYMDPSPPKGTALNSIPRIGLGTARMRGNTSEAIAQAIVNGFRHLDCAYIYGNQKDIGVGIKEGLKRTGLSRSDLWITSKLWNGDNRHRRAVFAVEESLAQLQLDYLDLFLVHWPHDNSDFKPSFDHVETWKEMQKVVRPTRGSRFIGVSNFGNQMIEDILKLDGIKPAYNEIELHPYLPQNDVVAFNQKRNITLIGYAPLGNTQNAASMGVTVDRNAVPPILQTEQVTSIAKARGCTSAQVVLAWNLHRGVVVIPKAIQASHQKENIVTLDKCKITDEDFAKMGTIKESIRFYPNACGYMPEGCEMAKKHSTINEEKRPSQSRRRAMIL